MRCFLKKASKTANFHQKTTAFWSFLGVSKIYLLAEKTIQPSCLHKRVDYDDTKKQQVRSCWRRSRRIRRRQQDFFMISSSSSSSSFLSAYWNLGSDMTFRFRKMWVFFFSFFLKSFSSNKETNKKQTNKNPTHPTDLSFFFVFPAFLQERKTKNTNTRQKQIYPSILHAFVDDFHLLAWLWKKWENCQAPQFTCLVSQSY